MRSLITEVTLLAKRNYCQYAHPEWLAIIDKVQAHSRLDPSEVTVYEQIEREILNIVNYKADVISGLTKNNQKQARLIYRDLLFIVKFYKGIGKVITIKFGSVYID